MANLLDSAGNQIFAKQPEASFITRFSHRHTVADAALSAMWNFRNNSSKIVRLRHVRGQMTYDGAATAATSLQIGFWKFTGATADPNVGTNVIPVAKRVGGGVSAISAGGIR